MRVMVWFYNHRDVLNPLMDENIDEEDEQDDLEKVKWICQIDVVDILKRQILNTFLRDVIE